MSTLSPRLAIERSTAALLVVDVQERLAAAMDAMKFARMSRNVETLVEAAQTFGMPIVATEQYPTGLGPTISTLKRKLSPLAPVSKMVFSSLKVEEVNRALKQTGRSQVIVVGMETHVCIFQSVRDLVAEGYAPFVPRDAVLSRTQENHDTGLSLMHEAGATLSSTEAIVFDLLGAAGSPEFKRLSALVK
jgi:nicotinamidase-related amidase